VPGTCSSCAGVEVESWNVTRWVRFSESARRKRGKQKVAGSARKGEMLREKKDRKA
jgi:hypothetical protein